jgi:hypothetical protein
VDFFLLDQENHPLSGREPTYTSLIYESFSFISTSFLLHFRLIFTHSSIKTPSKMSAFMSLRLRIAVITFVSSFHLDLDAKFGFPTVNFRLYFYHRIPDLYRKIIRKGSRYTINLVEE